MPLKGSITLESLSGDKDFMAAPIEKKRRYLQEVVLPAIDPDFSLATPEKQQAYIEQVALPRFAQPVDLGGVSPVAPIPEPGTQAAPQRTPSPPVGKIPMVNPLQGAGNIAGAAMQGLGDFAQAAVNPATYQQIGRDALAGVGAEINSRLAPAQGLQDFAVKSLMGTPATAFIPGAAKATRDIAAGVNSLPADIANAYLGQNTYQPAINIPDLPGVFQQANQQYPVTGFIAEQMPYLLPALRAGKATQAAKNISKAGEIARSAGEGAAIGAALDPQGGGIRGRAASAAMGGSVPVAAGVAGGLLSRSARLKPLSADEMRAGIQQYLRSGNQPRPIAIPQIQTEVKGRIVRQGETPVNDLPPPMAQEARPPNDSRLAQVFAPEDVAEIERLNSENTALEQAFSQRLLNDPLSIEREKRLAFRQLYGNGARTKGREAHIVLGPPGAGKSSAVAKRLLQERGALEIDSDAAKPFFAEFQNGVGAGAVHLPSDEVANRMYNAALESGDNVVLPLVGKNADKIKVYVDDLKSEGYKVYLHLVDLPANEAARRAWSRYKETGRFVNPEYVLSVGLKPRKTFAKLKTEVNIDGYSAYSNDVPFGQKPRLLEESESMGQVWHQNPARVDARHRRDDNGQLRQGQSRAVVQEETARVLKTKAQSDVYNIPLSEIKTDEGRFQRRSTAFNEAHVAQIAKNFDDAKLAPLVVWKDSPNGTSYLLSGHHRLEAMKRIGRQDAPVKYFKGTEQEARDFATASNASRLQYSALEKGRIIAEDIKAGKSIDDAAKSLNVTPDQARSLALLNELKGDWVTHFERAEVKPYTMAIARAVKKYELSDLEQQQLFKFLITEGNAKDVTPSKLTQLVELSNNLKSNMKKGGDQFSLFDTSSYTQTTGDAMKELINKAESINKQIKNIDGAERKLKQVKKAGVVSESTVTAMVDDLHNAKTRLEKDLADTGLEFTKSGRTQELKQEMQASAVKEEPPVYTTEGLSKEESSSGSRQGLLGKEFLKQDEQRNLFADEKPSQKQALEAKALRKQRARDESTSGGFIGFKNNKSTRLKAKVKSSAAFNASGAGVRDLVGTTRQKASMIDAGKEQVRNAFVYMSQVKDKTFVVGGQRRAGNKFIAEVDRLRSVVQKNYQDAELKIRNAVETIDDEPGYSAQDKIKDATQYLLYADYIRRAQEGQSVPGGLTITELSKGVNAIQGHIRKHPDVRKVVLNIRNLLKEVGNELVQAGIIEQPRKQYFPHQVLEHLQDVYGLPVRVKTPNRGYAKNAKGSSKDIETDLLGALDSHLKTIARHNAIDGFIQRVIGDFAEPGWKLGDPLPKDFVEFQPRSGRQYYTSYLIPESAVLQAVANHGGDLLIKDAGNLKTGMIVGSARKTYAIPREVVHYLDKLYEPKYLEGNFSVINKIVQNWKGLVTASPLNPGVIAFHFKNTIGDLENGLRDDPAFNRYILKAMREMRAAHGGKPTKTFMSAEEWGTIGAGYYGAELDLSNDFAFKRRFSNGFKDKALTRTPILSQAYKTYKNVERLVVKGGEAREDVLRYAKFLRDTDLGLEPWQAHIENGRTFINYNHLTRFERDVLRDSLLPFYTFYKANAVNWFQSITGQRGVSAAARAGALAFLFPMAASVWNQMTDPKTEDLLQDRKSKRYLANQLHIVTPYKDSKGNKIVIVLPTASNQAIQLFGMARLPYRLAKLVDSIYEGKVTMTDAIKEQISKAIGEDVFVPTGVDEGLPLPRPIAETLELLNPYIKEAAQQLFDYDLFMGRSISKGDDASMMENLAARARHMAGVAAPPYQRLTGLKFKDPALGMMDMVIGVFKAPDLYSWSDLKEDEVRIKQAQRTIKNDRLKLLYEKARQSLYEEKNRAVYDLRIGGKRYGEALTPEQRIRVDSLLKQSSMGNKLGYSATAKFGLLGLIKSADKAYSNTKATPAQKAKIIIFTGAMEKYLTKLEAAQESRVRAAITAVKATSENKMQGKIYKALTTGENLPQSVTQKIDAKVIGGNLNYIRPTQKTAK